MAPNPLHPEEYVLGGALRNILTECMLVDVREAPEGSLCPAATCALKPTAVLGGVTGYDSPEYTACPHRAPRTVQRTVHGAGPGALKTSAPLLAAQAARMVTPPSRPERGQRGVEAR